MSNEPAAKRRSDRGELGAEPLDVIDLACPQPDARVPNRASPSRERRVVGDEHAGGRAGIRENVGVGSVRGKHLTNLDRVLAAVTEQVRQTSRHDVVQEPRHRPSPGASQGARNVLWTEVRELL